MRQNEVRAVGQMQVMSHDRKQQPPADHHMKRVIHRRPRIIELRQGRDGAVEFGGRRGHVSGNCQPLPEGEARRKRAVTITAAATVTHRLNSTVRKLIARRVGAIGRDAAAGAGAASFVDSES